ncbi:hypothetical protein ACQJBY_015970 [Aegilops geniculata]
MVAAVADHPLVAAGASFLPNKPAPPRPPRQPPFPGRPQPAQPPHSVPFSRDLDLPPSSTSQLLFLEQSLQPPGAPLLRQQLLHEDPLHAKHASYSFSVPSSAILSTSSPLDSASSTSSPLPWHHFLYFSTDASTMSSPPGSASSMSLAASSVASPLLPHPSSTAYVICVVARATPPPLQTIL